MAAGINPGMIDTVIVSHYHGDHMNGLLKADNTPAFPNAEILVPAVEHKYWMDDGEMSRAPKGRIEGLFKNARRVFSGEVAKRVRTYEWDKDVVPGIAAVGTPGHSPGHTSFVVSSGPSKVFVQSDLTHVPYLFVRNPGWHAFYDQDAVMAEATRRKALDMLVAEKMMVQGFHYPFPAHAYIEKTATGYRETMVRVERGDLIVIETSTREAASGRPFVFLQRASVLLREYHRLANFRIVNLIKITGRCLDAGAICPAESCFAKDIHVGVTRRPGIYRGRARPRGYDDPRHEGDGHARHHRRGGHQHGVPRSREPIPGQHLHSAAAMAEYLRQNTVESAPEHGLERLRGMLDRSPKGSA